MKKLQVIILFVFLVSCSSNQTASPTAIPEILPVTGSLTTETVAPPTETLTPTLTAAPIFTSAPTLEPLPTFFPDDGMEKLQSWLQGTFDCLLPCWGGIIPGKTTWQEAKQLLEQMTGFSTVNVSENGSCDFGPCNGIAWSLYPQTLAEGVFYTKFPENIVHSININIQNEGTQKTNLLRNVGLQEVFIWYGAPPVLLFRAEPDREGDKFLEVIMVYPERQFIIRYLKLADLVDDKLVNCGKDSQIELIVLDNKEQLSSLDAIANAVETKGLHIDAGYKSVEEAIGMTNHSFYVAFSTSNSACISTPVNIWLP